MVLQNSHNVAILNEIIMSYEAYMCVIDCDIMKMKWSEILKKKKEKKKKETWNAMRKMKWKKWNETKMKKWKWNEMKLKL